MQGVEDRVGTLELRQPFRAGDAFGMAYPLAGGDKPGQIGEVGVGVFVVEGEDRDQKELVETADSVGGEQLPPDEGKRSMAGSRST